MMLPFSITPKQENRVGLRFFFLCLFLVLGYVLSQLALGNVFEIGEGTPKDLTQAVKHYTMGAEQGNANCQYQLGRMCYHGVGVTKDLEKAFYWFQLSADQKFGNG